MTRLMLGLLAAAISFSAQAAIYKWVDDKGNVQFTDQPPPPKVKGAAITVKSASGPARAPAPASDAAKEGGGKGEPVASAPAAPGDEQAAEKQKAELKKQKDEQAKIKDLNCKQAKLATAALQNQGRVRTVNAKGEVEYVSDEQRPNELKRAQKDADYWCNGK